MLHDVFRLVVRGGEAEIPAGLSGLVDNVMDIDQALQVGLSVPLGDLTPLEFRALLSLRRSRAAWEEHQAKLAQKH